jgi:hypothetical protein
MKQFLFKPDYVQHVIAPFFMMSMNQGERLSLPMIDMTLTKENALPYYLLWLPILKAFSTCIGICTSASRASRKHQAVRVTFRNHYRHVGVARDHSDFCLRSRIGLKAERSPTHAAAVATVLRQRDRRLLVSLIDQERRSGFASHCVVSHDRDSAVMPNILKLRNHFKRLEVKLKRGTTTQVLNS